MNYAQCTKLGERGVSFFVRNVVPKLYDRYVLTDKGRLSKEIQAKYGDAFVNNPNGEIVSIEIKTEKRFTGNLFIETWSNKGYKKGWFHTLDCDKIFFLFDDTTDCYLIDFPAMKEYVISRINSFKTVSPHRNGIYQMNQTEGILFPIGNCDYPFIEYKWDFMDFIKTEYQFL